MRSRACDAGTPLMTTKQIQIVMRDMLFITWAVDPDVARKLVDPRLELDTRIDSTGREAAYVSAVAFRVTDLQTGAMLMPSLAFEQINYRVYVKADDVPAVCFLGVRVNSRMVTALTSFMTLPVQYEDIGISTGPGNVGQLRYSIQSAGFRADTIVGEPDAGAGSDSEITPAFITHRLFGYVAAGDGMFKIEVEQPGLVPVFASVQSVTAPILKQFGVLTDQSARPHSALYVRDALFGTNTPTRFR